MSSFPLKCSWKYKMKLINIFDEDFLKEKDLALQPIDLNIQLDNSFNKNNLTKKDISTIDSIQLKNEGKERKTLKLPNNLEVPKKKSLKSSDLYSSNIVIIQSMTEDGSVCSSINKIEREIKKINRMISRSRTKKPKKKNSDTKILKTSKSTKY